MTAILARILRTLFAFLATDWNALVYTFSCRQSVRTVYTHFSLLVLTLLTRLLRTTWDVRLESFGLSLALSHGKFSLRVGLLVVTVSIVNDS